MKIIETYLPLKRPSAGPFFKSTLAEIHFTIYKEEDNIMRVLAPVIASEILGYILNTGNKPISTEVVD